MPKYTVRMMGALEVSGGERSTDRFETRKTALLLSLLALEPGRARSRDELGAILWPGDEPEDVRPRLRQAIAALKRTFSDDADAAVVADRLTVSLNPEWVTSDTEQFRFLVKRSQLLAEGPDRAKALESANECWRGEFLPGFADEWVLAERAQLATERSQALELLVEAWLAAGNQDGAIDAASRWVQLDPLRATAVNRAMEIAAAQGRLAEAVIFYKLHRDRLRDELKMDAAPEMKSYAAQLRKEARLKGIDVDDLGESEVATTPAPPVYSTRHLPQRLTAIFGRDADLAVLRDLTEPGSGTRLVTITGMGGVGKTRISLELAWQQIERYEGRVWFVPLANVRDPESIGGAILDSTGTKRAAALDLDQLVTTFGDSPHLLILDNYEQIVDGGAEFLHELLERTPAVTAVVTSRRMLELGYEREFPLVPLPTPSGKTIVEQLLTFSSVQMFVERAQQALPSFELDQENALVVADLCNRLEGIPLALALATSRLQVMSPKEILAGLDARFDVLTTRRRDLPDRHRSLRASFEWSFDLLPEAARRVLAQMSVFRGGSSIEALKDVCATQEVLDSIEVLVEHGLIQEIEADGARRFDMLESLREFAAEHLEAEEAVAARKRHCDHFSGFAVGILEGIRSKERQQVVARTDQELDNLRIAMQWALEHDPVVALKLACNQGQYWHLRGMLREGRDWFERVIAANTLESSGADYGRAFNGIGILLDRLGLVEEATSALERSVEVFDQIGAHQLAHNPLNNLGNLSLKAADYERAEGYLSRSLAIFESDNDLNGIAMVLGNMGNLACARGDFDTARERLERALAMNRASGNQPWEANNLASLGIAASYSGHPEEAVEVLSQALALQKQLGYMMGISNASIQLSEALRRRGTPSEALARVQEALAVGLEVDAKEVITPALRETGMVLEALGHPGLAAEFWGAGEALAEITKAGIHTMERRIYETAKDRARTALGPTFDARFELGRIERIEDLVQKLEATIGIGS